MPSQELEELRRRADALLSVEPPTVVRKQVLPPSGDIHDYISLPPYAWPNPETPDGMPWIQRDGYRNPATMEIPDKRGLYRLIELAWTLGQAHRHLGRPEYSEKAALCLRTWFLDPDTRMNPN